jgi:hypothetical protein
MGSHHSTNAQKSDQNVGTSSPTTKIVHIERRNSLSREGSNYMSEHEREHRNENNSYSVREVNSPKEMANRKKKTNNLSDYCFSLSALLSLSDFRELFEKFIDGSDEWRDEYKTYLEFLDKVDKFQAKTSSVHRFRLAEDIVEHYIKPIEENNLFSLSDSVRQEILNEFSFCSEQVIPSKLFDEAYDEAIKQLSDGPFSQFMKTKQYKEFIKEKLHQMGDNFLSDAGMNMKASQF